MGGGTGGTRRRHARSRSTGDLGVALVVEGKDGSARQHNSIEADRLSKSVLQLGKLAGNGDEFSCSVLAPLSPFQAFAMALCVFEA
mmetsp:Transcript_85097/g.241188  ORF Transcript_85097/g.241188 Transcript_85097/m.241188 type:complete len:86 (+) Transcript_85097:271-528(+)